MTDTRELIERLNEILKDVWLEDRLAIRYIKTITGAGKALHKQAQEIDCNRIIMDRDLGNIRKLEARIKELEGELRGARNAIISAHAEYALAPGMECKCKWCYPQEPSHD